VVARIDNYRVFYILQFVRKVLKTKDLQECVMHEICFVFYILRSPPKSMKTLQFKSNVLLDLAGVY
jgi:hypothetical protein